jgi:hypothetical protein
LVPSALANFVLKYSKDEKRMAILGTIPVITAPKPLYREGNPSF